MLPLKTILHPTDLSEHADYAYQIGSLIAHECGAQMIVLHVAGMHIDVPLPIHTELGLAFDCSGDYQKHHTALKERLHQRFQRHSGSNVQLETLLVYGPAAEEILHVARNESCDLIVMGTHGRSGLGRLLVGSVAEEVMRKAQCPVLTVRAPAHLA